MRYCTALVLAVLCAAGPASATTYTVSTNGSDNNNGTTAPFRTLQKAVSAIRDGDTIVLTAGTYTAGAYITRRNITVRGVGEVTLDGSGASRDDGLSFFQTSGITIEGIRIRNARRKGLFITLSQGVTVRNCEFVNNTKDGFLTGNVSDVLVENCLFQNNGYHGLYLSQSGDRYRVIRNTFTGNAAAGIQINAIQSGANASDPASDGRSRDCVIEGNTITGCGSLGGAALNMMGVQDSLIVNNLLVNNLAGGIAMWDDGAGSTYACKNNRIYHNTVLFQQGKGRFALQCLAGCTGNEIYNNILACGSGPALDVKTTVRSNYNCLSGGSIANGSTLASWRNSTGNDLNSIQGVPALTGNYRPAAGSAARDAGYQVYGTDKDGRLRPQGPNPDLGCFEEPYGGSGGSDGSGAAAPSAPSGLHASAGDGRVTLTWSAASGGVSGYHVYRSNSQSGTYSRRTGSAVSTTTFTDSGLSNGATYWYRVTAVGTNGAESERSAAVSATPSAPAVQTYTISGTVTANGSGLEGVLVAGGGQSTLTTANGAYTLSQVVAGTYTISASRSGYTLSAPHSVTVGPSRTGVNFTATASAPSGGDGTVIYDDALRNAWRSRKGRAKVTLSATSPVAQGRKSIALTVKGTDGYVEFAGDGIPVAGKRHLKFSIHGGKKGGQQLRVRSIVNGVKQENSLNLSQYGGLPVKNGWKEYTIPLADLQATNGTLTGVKFFAGKKQKKAYIDYIRVE